MFYVTFGCLNRFLFDIYYFILLFANILIDKIITILVGWPKSLFREVSEGLSHILDDHIHSYSRGELIILRRRVLDDLACIQITEETYNPKEHFWTVSWTRYARVNDFYNSKIDE